MKSLVAVTLALLITGASLAQKHSASKPQAQQWRPYVYPDDGFAITLPAQATPRNDGGDRHIHVYSVRLADGAVFSLRAVHRLTDCETTLADLWDKADSNKDPKEPVIRGTLKEVSLSGLRGLEYETGSSDQRSLHRFHCGDKIFYIISAGYKGKRPADVNRIISSFQVVNPAHQ
ncbi:MAG TPA: hypothetical protein VFQ41_10930 [Candidatus Angelobacter sp.]|nr:hypothetical protein [Candidatus Angelobacter sp.]